MSTMALRLSNPLFPFWSHASAGSDQALAVPRRELEVRLAVRAWKERSFQDDLVANPRGVVLREFGIPIPEVIRPHVLVESAEDMFMVFPHNPFHDLGEEALRRTCGLTLDDVARWVLQDRLGTLLDETRSIDLVAGAWRDDTFLKRLLEAPAEVLRDAFGITLPSDCRCRAVAETPHDLYIVIPWLRTAKPPEFDPCFGADANLGPRYIQVLQPTEMGCTICPCTICTCTLCTQTQTCPCTYFGCTYCTWLQPTTINEA